MDKYAVEQVRNMQKATLEEVRTKLASLRRAPHTKTAEHADDLARLERQERELVEAIAGPDPQQ